MKTRQDIFNQYYVNRQDIQRLLKIPKEKARKVFVMVDEVEKQKRFRAHESKVPLKDVLKTAGIDYQFLKKQIESEAR